MKKNRNKLTANILITVEIFLLYNISIEYRSFSMLIAFINEIRIYMFLSLFERLSANAVHRTLGLLDIYIKGRRRGEFKNWKLKRIKTQVMSRHPWYSGLARGSRVAETWVRLPASAGFFICSVASFLLCCHCEVLEGPTE